MRAKHFEYWITLDEGGRLSAEGQPTGIEEDVGAEHLLLAALARCLLASLTHFAHQKGVEAHGSAYASGTVTRREEDDRYGFTEIECRIEVDLDGELADTDLKELLASAEWGCFVGASLSPAPRYKWRVNGRDL